METICLVVGPGAGGSGRGRDSINWRFDCCFWIVGHITKWWMAKRISGHYCFCVFYVLAFSTHFETGTFCGDRGLLCEMVILATKKKYSLHKHAHQFTYEGLQRSEVDPQSLSEYIMILIPPSLLRSSLKTCTVICTSLLEGKPQKSGGFGITLSQASVQIKWRVWWCQVSGICLNDISLHMIRSEENGI